MTFIPGFNRKRRQSSPALPPTTSARSFYPPSPKKSKLSHFFDGADSPSLDSTSTGRSMLSMKEQLKKRVIDLKTMISRGQRGSDTSVQHNPDVPWSLTQQAQSTYVAANGSNTTTVHNPLKMRLTAFPEDVEVESDTNSISRIINSAPITPGLHRRLEDDYDFSSSLDESKRSQSAPGPQRRASQKFRQVFGNATSTVIKKPNMRSRPSVQTLAMESAAASAYFSSTPSTLNSGGSFWGTRTNTSTPLTSDPSTPRSIVRRGSMESLEAERYPLVTESRVLTPIPETNSLPKLTIKTVEAAATAKMHLELHFNELYKGTSTRISRRRELERGLKENRLPIDSQIRARKAWEKAESDNLRQYRVLKNTTKTARASEGISPGSFEVISILGKGSFGVVRLVKANSPETKKTREGRNSDRFPAGKASNASLKSSRLSGPFLGRRRSTVQATAQVYAMKVIRKSDMIRNGQEGHLRAERDFLVAAEGSRWIIPLIAAFQDRKHLYLVMEYCIGGDFLGLLIRKNVLSEEVTKWFVAEMVLCVEEAHRLRWIHRDVKPDNFLIGLDGHLKISDFGLAFDGDWTHDQRFYHENRISLLEELGVTVEGDELDKQEKQAQAASKKRPKEEPKFKDGRPGGELILDYRNRAQRRRLARSVVGTSQYMAPEVIRGEMYDGRCD